MLHQSPLGLNPLPAACFSVPWAIAPGRCQTKLRPRLGFAAAGGASSSPVAPGAFAVAAVGARRPTSTELLFPQSDSLLPFLQGPDFLFALFFASFAGSPVCLLLFFFGPSFFLFLRLLLGRLGRLCHLWCSKRRRSWCCFQVRPRLCCCHLLSSWTVLVLRARGATPVPCWPRHGSVRIHH